MRPSYDSVEELASLRDLARDLGEPDPHPLGEVVEIEGLPVRRVRTPHSNLGGVHAWTYAV